jgi:hypothetical protein
MKYKIQTREWAQRLKPLHRVVGMIDGEFVDCTDDVESMATAKRQLASLNKGYSFETVNNYFQDLEHGDIPCN